MKLWAASCKAWSRFRKLYNGFAPRHKLTWGDVDRSMACFSKRKVEESDKAVEIYLTETEL